MRQNFFYNIPLKNICRLHDGLDSHFHVVFLIYFPSQINNEVKIKM